MKVLDIPILSNLYPETITINLHTYFQFFSVHMYACIKLIYYIELSHIIQNFTKIRLHYYQWFIDLKAIETNWLIQHGKKFIGTITGQMAELKITLEKRKNQAGKATFMTQRASANGHCSKHFLNVSPPTMFNLCFIASDSDFQERELDWVICLLF